MNTLFALVLTVGLTNVTFQMLCRRLRQPAAKPPQLNSK
jgi:hypothetical protein